MLPWSRPRDRRFKGLVATRSRTANTGADGLAQGHCERRGGARNASGPRLGVGAGWRLGAGLDHWKVSETASVKFEVEPMSRNQVVKFQVEPTIGAITLPGQSLDGVRSRLKVPAAPEFRI